MENSSKNNPENYKTDKEIEPGAPYKLYQRASVAKSSLYVLSVRLT